MNNKETEKNFAKKYWRNFETLTLSLLKHMLQDENEYNFYIHETPERKDGGFDGIIIVEPKKTLDLVQELYTILTEAKLRKNANKDLPLSDFAKTLIIAINRNAMAVYIFTNLHFSAETYRKIYQFSAATSLHVQLVDIFEICNELNNFPEVQTNFPDEFIDSLFAALPLHNPEKRFQYQYESIFSSDLPELIGDYRNGLVNEYIQYFRERTGVFLIKGIQSSGKTLLIKHIINSLQYELNCKIIQLEKFSTIKEFFIYLLSLIWNVDTIDIYNLTEETLDEITLFLPEQRMAKRVKTILLNIIGHTPTEYENREEVFEGHLIEYLHYIFTPICRRKKQLFAFTNFEKCTKNILNFTNKFIRKFSSENIIILAEMRTDIAYLKKYIDEWSLLNPDVRPVELSEFDYLEYYQYMQNKYPDMSLVQLQNIYSACFLTPLYIDNFLTFINDNDLENILLKDELNIKKLYKNEKFKEKTIFYSLNNYLKSQNRFCKELAYIISFFDGELSLDNINKLGSDFQEAIAPLADSIYFDLERDVLKIHHIVYLRAIQNENIVNNYEYNEILKLLFLVIDNLELDANVKRIKKLEIAIDYQEKEYVLQNWKILCDDLINQNDFSFAKQLLEKILKMDIFIAGERICLINRIIKCYLGLNEYKSKNLISYIKYGSEELEFCSVKKEKLFYYYLRAKYYFTSGRYQEIISLTDAYKNEEPQLRYIRALSIKHIYGIDACLLSLERGKKHFPEDWHLQYSYLDHLHSKYEKIDSEKSWFFLLQIEKYWDKLDFEDQIHYKYNKIALKLYRTGFVEIKECKDLIIKTFESILPVEESRIHNLLGQLYCIQNNFESAEEEYKKSLAILSQHVHATYIYVPLINLALLYNYWDEKLLCIHYTVKVLDYLFQYKKEKIERQLSDIAKKIVIEKECASFIVAMELIKNLEPELFKKYSIKFAKYNPKEHSSSILPKYYRLNDKITFRC